MVSSGMLDMGSNRATLREDPLIHLAFCLAKNLVSSSRMSFESRLMALLVGGGVM